MHDKVFLLAAQMRKPTLILQGDADEEALPVGAEKLFKSIAAEDKTLKIIPGAGHSLFGSMFTLAFAENDPEKRALVMTELKGWLTAH